MTHRKFDSYQHMLEFARLQAVERAAESVTDDVRQVAIDNALAQIETARIWLHRLMRRMGPIRDLNEAVRALDAAVRELTPTCVESEPVVEVWDVEQVMAREG